MLNRYQFELLAYLEENGPCLEDIRALASQLCISGIMIQECLKEGIKKRWILRGHGVIEITEEGVMRLEPYRVKRAVILAAGFGSRMMPATAEQPKPMVSVQGRRLIETLLDALVGCDIREITIVRGYCGEKFNTLLEQYPFIRFIDNHNYDQYNNISSAILLAEDFVEGAYLCEADLYITNPKVIRKYQFESNILGSWSLETDDWCYRLDKQGEICDYQKGGTNCWNYYGISYWTADDCLQLNKDWNAIFTMEDGKDVFWEEVPLILRRDDYHVRVRPCQKSDIIEIDNYYELAQLDASYQEGDVRK